MVENKTILWIGIIGLLLYALSTADWSKMTDLLSTIGKILFGGAVIYALSKMS